MTKRKQTENEDWHERTAALKAGRIQEAAREVAKAMPTVVEACDALRRFSELLASTDELPEAEPKPEPRPVWPGEWVRRHKDEAKRRVVGQGDIQSMIVVSQPGGSAPYRPKFVQHLTHLDGAPVSGLVDLRLRRTSEEEPEGDRLVMAWDNAWDEWSAIAASFVRSHPDKLLAWYPMPPAPSWLKEVE